jgi:hypothetical protein
METIFMLKRFLNAALAIVALSMVGGLVNKTLAGPPDAVAICHATSAADGHYNYLELPPEPLSAHFDEHGTPKAGHEKDFFPVDGDCDKSNDPGGSGDDPGGPGGTPEPITILLFGAGVAGVGYASRKLRRNKKAESDS